MKHTTALCIAIALCAFGPAAAEAQATGAAISFDPEYGSSRAGALKGGAVCDIFRC